MSLIPVDESESAGHGGEQGDDEGASESLVRRTLARVASGVRAVCGALRDGVRSPFRHDTDTEQGEYEPATDGSGPAALTEPVRYGSVDDTPSRDAESPVRALPDSDSPALAGPEAEKPELTARWENDELTLQVPGNPDASISSDVWEDVER